MSAPAGTAPSSDTLPRRPRRGRSTAWGGVALLVVIELAAFISLVVSYFYLRVMGRFWPPPGVDLPDVLKPSLETGLLVGALVPLHLGVRAWRQGRPRAVTRWVGVVPAVVAGALALKWVELRELPFLWSSHAYGSIVWTLHGYSALHGVALLLGLGLVWMLHVRGHLDEERGTALEALALYADFVAASAVLTWLTTTLSPYLL